MLFTSTTLIAVLGLASTSQAHVFMNTPKIFPGTISSPLNLDGSNFPCQKPVTFDKSIATTMALGSTQPLAFTGSAVHGGGSCQLSITYDQSPTKDSTWKVIHSIHGGCPMRNIDGNNGNDATLVSPSTYSFLIPSNLPAGNAILAWTWFNKIGNREMYMNCAPIILSGSNARRSSDALEAAHLVQRDQAAYNALPNMFRGNIFGPECVTAPERVNLLFPNPGTSVEKNTDNMEFGAPKICDTAAPAPSQVVPVPTTSAAAPTKTTTSSSTKPTLPGGVFAPVDPTRVLVPNPSASATKSATLPPPAPTTTKVTAPTTKVTVPTSAPQPTTLIVIPTKPTTTAVVAPPAATGASGIQSGPCSTEGLWNCIGGTSFQQCGSGSWSTPQQLAAGTKCTPGQSSAINITAIKSKRSPRFSSSHLKRHLSNRH